MRANPDPDLPPVYENPNLIPRIVHQGSSIIPVFKAQSCPIDFEYIEDLEFDEQFELSLFETKSESVIANFLETASATLGSSAISSSSRIPTKPPFIPTIPVQPTVSNQKSAVVSPPSTPSTPKIAKISSPPHTPPHTPHTSAPPTSPTSPRPIENPPRAMVARFAPLVLPQNLDDMLANYQRKIPLFDGTPHGVIAQQHVDRMTDFYDLHEIDVENVTMRLFVQTFGGEVRKWFGALPAASVTTLADL